MKLLIVESPAKTKTISKYIGNSAYTIKASIGHIRDLPKSNKDAIDIEGGFIPHYEISKGKEKVVSELKSLGKKADEILLAMDPDREGEAIAWHLYELLNEAKVKAPIKRITFNEITESAVKGALQNPRKIDMDLKRAQEARRVLDRLVGYDLSGLIWKKVRYGLSAGRVQSPALRILVEREKEIKKFDPVTYWAISGEFQNENQENFIAECSKEPVEEKEVKDILKLSKENDWKVLEVKETQAKRSPYAPFTTSTLQQTASSRLGFAPSRTMGVAQKLYEAGHITYMRTDSNSISQTVLPQIYKTIEKEFGKEFVQPRAYKSRSKNAQEAHEAVRPAHISVKSAGFNEDQKRLYKLIYNRTLSSQMKDAQLLKTKIKLNIESEKIPFFSINGSRLLDPGWLALDTISRGDDVEVPKMSENETVKLLSVDSEQKETLPPNRYTEAGLVKELEKRGIGRPSTYASIIKTIIDRGYVDKENKSLRPTDTGEVVSDFLSAHFLKYIGDSFTAEMEDNLDEIADGKKEYVKTLTEFYTPFSKEVKDKESVEKITNLGNADKKHKCPTCKGKMIIKLGKAEKFLSCAKFPDCSGARTMDGIERQGPKEIGEDCPKCKDGKLVEREGKYGLFISCNNFPKCKFIKESEEELRKRKTGVKCPDCKDGEMVERNGRFGIFYSCSNYPSCKHAIKAKPTGAKCDMCEALIMEGTKTIPERCSVKTCPNHRPDKLKKAGEKK